MQSLVENAKVVSVLVPASRSSAATGDAVSFENYDKATFIVQTGAVTAGGNVTFHKSAVAAMSSSARIDITTYHKGALGTDTYTKTSANSSGSYGCITIGNSSDSKVFIVEIPAALVGPTYKFVTCKVPGAFSAALTAAIAVMSKSRYQQSSPPTALT